MLGAVTGKSLLLKTRFVSISDLGTNVAETEDLISVLDDDVTDLAVLVSTLQEENAQLQQTVNLLLQRVSALEAIANATENTLDGITFLLVVVNVMYWFDCSSVILPKLSLIQKTLGVQFEKNKF